jgi:succinoglycan biosynthesis transport protein ExoP
LAEQLNDETEFIDLRAYLRVISKRRNVIIAGTLIVLLITGILSFFILPPVYEAQSILLVNQATDTTQVVQQQQSDDSVQGIVQQYQPILTMNTYMGEVKSDELLRRVIKKLKLDPQTYTPGSLEGMIEATVQQNSNLIEITVQNKDPKMAADIANTVSSEFLAFLTEKNQEQMESSVASLQQQRKNAQKELSKNNKALQNAIYYPQQTTEEEKEMLESEVDRLKETVKTLDKKITETQIAQSLQQGQNTVTVVSNAAVPVSPSKPNKLLNLAVALVLGVVLSTGLAFLLEYLDYTIKTPEDVTEQLGLPSLGVIPLITERSHKASYGK